jgi:hypothetical protein
MGASGGSPAAAVGKAGAGGSALGTEETPQPTAAAGAVGEKPKPESAVAAIPAVPVKRIDDGRTDRGFPASAVQVGGGMAEFSMGKMRSQTTRGPYWDLRGIIGLRRLLALEAAVVGAAYPMVGERYGRDAMILRNGVEVGPRLNLPVEDKAGLLLLYGTVGLGLSNYRLVRASTAGMMVNDYAATVPLAAGITMGYARFLVDVRIGYRFTFRDQLLGETVRPVGSTGSPPENRLRDFSFGVQVGYEL